MSKGQIYGFIMSYVAIAIASLITIALIARCYGVHTASNCPFKAVKTAQDGQSPTVDPNATNRLARDIIDSFFHSCYVQNIYEAQKRLKEQGFYKGKVDGKWGSLLQDRAYCDYCAVKAIKEEVETPKTITPSTKFGFPSDYLLKLKGKP